MSRPKTPTNVLKLRGTLPRHKDRRAEPVPTAELGDPPPHLDAATLAAWREIVEIAPRGVLMNADRLAVELAAGLMAQFRQGDMLPAGIGHLRALLGRLGLTPGDRASLSIPLPAAPANDPWAEFRIS